MRGCRLFLCLRPPRSNNPAHPVGAVLTAKPDTQRAHIDITTAHVRVTGKKRTTVGRFIARA